MGYCVWLYYTFPLSYRDIEKMMVYRGVEVTYESIREWCQKFGQQFANGLQYKRPYIMDKWHLDEMVVTNTRSVSQRQQETAILSVASSGFRRKCAGCLAATASRHEGSRAILPQAVKETGLRATGDCHRQAEE